MDLQEQELYDNNPSFISVMSQEDFIYQLDEKCNVNKDLEIENKDIKLIYFLILLFIENLDL